MSNIQVKIIQQKGQAALVQWVTDGTKLNRGTIPTEAITADEKGQPVVSETDLQFAIPYGVNWSAFIPKLDPEVVEQKLYQYGIWTAADAVKYPQRFMDALIDSIQLVRADIVKAVLNNKGD
jgi:hypothetical protein